MSISEDVTNQIITAITEGLPGATFPNQSLLALPTTGFLVGGKVPSFIIEPGVRLFLSTQVQLFEWVSRQHDASYIGMWVGPSGNIYIDAVDWVVSRGHALGLATRRGELEIRDVAADRNIPVSVDHSLLLP
jgi:hypothetical protein